MTARREKRLTKRKREHLNREKRIRYELAKHGLALRKDPAPDNFWPPRSSDHMGGYRIVIRATGETLSGERYNLSLQALEQDIALAKASNGFRQWDSEGREIPREQGKERI